MAAHEKVIVDRGFLNDKDHGKITCAECHGGNPELPGMEASHKGMVRDPTAKEARRVCGECHEEIVAKGENSLHTTLRP